MCVCPSATWLWGMGSWTRPPNDFLVVCNAYCYYYHLKNQVRALYLFPPFSEPCGPPWFHFWQPDSSHGTGFLISLSTWRFDQSNSWNEPCSGVDFHPPRGGISRAARAKWDTPQPALPVTRGGVSGWQRRWLGQRWQRSWKVTDSQYSIVVSSHVTTELVRCHVIFPVISEITVTPTLSVTVFYPSVARWWN